MWLLDYKEEDPDDLLLDDDALKTLFFQMMPQTWQLDFGAINLEITDNDISFEHVVCFMKKKEKADKIKRKSVSTPKWSRDDDLGPYSGKRACGCGGHFNQQDSRQHSPNNNNNDSNHDNYGGRGSRGGGCGGGRGSGRGG